MNTKRVAKVAVLNPKGEVLLLRRSHTDDRRPGEWDFPGGGVEDSESFEQAAARETDEEAGIVFEQSQLKLIYTATEFYAPRKENVHRALFAVRIGETASQNVTLSFEHDDSRWVTIDQALRDFPHPFYGTGLRYARDHSLLA